MNERQRYQNFVDWTKKQYCPLTTIFPTIQKKDIFHIDLSKKNTTVKTEAEFNNPDFFGKKLEEIQEANPTKIIAGGYLEKRALYTSDIYNAKDSSEKRNIHLGLDFWLPEKTSVHSLFDGEIICAVYQKDHKGYGGFVIIKHQTKETTFYTLYGHLSEESISNFSVNDLIKKGEKIGVLGNYDENGEWVCHLHFQLMLTLLEYKNDFPGVALKSEIDFWKAICPNPNLLFKSDALSIF
jgi:murein DD-endopeptidase MepM/ murein hydrolase activator NlpD